MSLEASKARSTRLAACLALCLAAACASPALAQYSQPIFLEAARDPGQADVPVTARSLALGGLQIGSHGADMSLVNPALLAFGRGTDLAASGGGAWHARDELVATPAQLPPRDPTRARTSRTGAPIAYGALATRVGPFAFAGFYDASSRLQHTFSTSLATLAFATVYGFGYEHRGQGTATADIRARRIGGSVAFAPVPGRLSIGLSVWGVRLDYRVSSEVAVETRSFTPAASPWTSAGVDQDGVEFHSWGPGFVLAAAARPAAWVTLSGRWRHEPAFDAVRHLAEAPGLSNVTVDEPVRFDLPDTVSVGAAFEAAKTVVGVEVSRSRYATAFGPAESGPGFGCGQLTTVYCSGWAFETHAPANATRLAGGIEHAFGAGRGEIVLRGGAGYEQAYTLARSASDPARDGGALPAAPVVSDFEPPRDPATVLGFGLGWRLARWEIGGALSVAGPHLRFLADLRVQLR